jgi:hypothetical protein
MLLQAGLRAIRFHFFPERRGLREAMVVSSTPTSRSSECRCACLCRYPSLRKSNVDFRTFFFEILFSLPIAAFALKRGLC